MNKVLVTTITLLVASQIAPTSWWNTFPLLTKSQKNPQIEQTFTTTVASDSYPVVKVVDGDTLSVDMHGTVTTLRLIGINTPETVDPRRPVECFGKEASQKAKELLVDKKVRVATDASQGALDKYNRTLAYVFLENETNFNEYMIREGYAYEYTYNTPYQFQKEFKLAQSEAQKSKRGLWADGVCGIKNISTEIKPTPTQPSKISVEQPKTETPHITLPTQTVLVQQPQTKVATNTKYICSYDAYNCTRDFSTHVEAQAVYESCGGTTNDVHKLDKDKDGQACETLP